MGVMLKILARHCRRELSRPCVHAPHRFRPFGVSFQQVVGFSTKPSHSSPPKPQQAPFNNHHKPKPPKQKLRMSFTPGANAVSVVTGTGEIARCNINLTETECQVFSLLVEVTGSYPELAKTTVRVAGGWVRDKILGRPCHDLDIALDTHTGEAFAEFVNRFLVNKGHSVSRIGVIAANPEQSKHLETATVKVLGQEVDFVNLRSEEYAEDSRIPTMRFGTAEEDASRRDFTINAMFYNVNRRVIEDLTGCGYTDLMAGLLRTPLPPLTTFRDDPLRVMRAVRFASRFGFALHDDILKAVGDEGIQKALMTKVSKERIGGELDNMLKGEAPLRSVALLHALGLMQLIFTVVAVPYTPVSFQATGSSGDGSDAVSSTVTVPTPNTPSVTWDAAARITTSAMDVLAGFGGTPLDPSSTFVADREGAVRLLCYAGMTVGYAGAIYAPKPSRTDAVTRYLMREATKSSTADADAITLIHTGCVELLNLSASYHTVLTDYFSDTEFKIRVGRLIRTLKAPWPLSLALALAVANEVGRSGEIAWLRGLGVQIATDPGVCNAWSIKPLLNGNDIAKTFGVKGPAIGGLMEKQIELMMVNPAITVEELTVLLRDASSTK